MDKSTVARIDYLRVNEWSSMILGKMSEISEKSIYRIIICFEQWCSKGHLKIDELITEKDTRAILCALETASDRVRIILINILTQLINRVERQNHIFFEDPFWSLICHLLCTKKDERLFKSLLLLVECCLSNFSAEEIISLIENVPLLRSLLISGPSTHNDINELIVDVFEILLESGQSLVWKTGHNRVIDSLLGQSENNVLLEEFCMSQKENLKSLSNLVDEYRY